MCFCMVWVHMLDIQHVLNQCSYMTSNVGVMSSSNRILLHTFPLMYLTREMQSINGASLSVRDSSIERIVLKIFKS